MGFFHRFAPLSLCCALLLGMTSPVYAQGEEIIYYEAPELVADVYLPYQGGFSDFEAAMGGGWDGMQYLYPDGDEYADGLLFTNTQDNQDGDAFTALLTQAAATSETEFTYPVTYGIAETYWEDEPEKLELWNQGLLQARPASFDVTVHLRPGDLAAVYRPDPASPILTVWADRDDPFESLYLTDYDTLRQTDSPYDTERLDFQIDWDEQSYSDGMAGGADRFYVTGTYTGLYGWSEDWQQTLYNMGLIQAEGEAKTLIRIHVTGQQLYYNPYSSWLQKYGNPYEFQIHIRPGTGFDEAVLPAAGMLDPFEGDAMEFRAFGLSWSQEEYERGLASGADSFTVPGAYGPNLAWTAEDLADWETGAIKILDNTPAPALTVNVLPDDIPFTVAMEYRSYGEELEECGGLIPTFSFPWPNGASEVTWAFSFDKETWYQNTLAWSTEWECGDVWCEGYYVDENDKLAAIPEDEPIPFYCKLTVTGSAFAGETAVMIVTPDEDGNWNMTEDPGGDHGGGGQGEHDRPGKEEPDGSPEPPTPDPEPEPDVPSHSDDASEPEPIWPLPVWPEWPPIPEVIPTPAPVPTPEPAPVVPAPSPQEEQPVLADIPIQAEPSAPPPAGGEKISMSADAQTVMVPEAPPKAAPSPSEATTGETDPAAVPESQTPQPTLEPASEPPASPAPKTVPQAPAAHIPGFVVAVAVTAAVILGGAAWFHWRGKRK